MADEVKNDAWHVELCLRVILRYTEEQIAEVWEQQRLPNRIEDGVRIVDREEAMAFVEQLLKQRLEDNHGRATWK